MSWHFPRRSPSVTAPQTPPPYTGAERARTERMSARAAVRARAPECTGARQCACASVTATTTVCCCSARSRFSLLTHSPRACARPYFLALAISSPPALTIPPIVYRAARSFVHSRRTLALSVVGGSCDVSERARRHRTSDLGGIYRVLLRGGRR